MQILIETDSHGVGRRAAEIVLKAIERKPGAVLALPTGDTPLGFYKELVEATEERGADFSHIRIFNLDEYVGLSDSHRGSYTFYMYSNFLSRIDLPKGAAHIFDGMAADPEAECARYEREIAVSGGLDVAVLGIGVNGHIAFNEPGTPFDSKCHVAELSPSTIKNNMHHFRRPEEMPRRAMTMGLKTITGAKKIVLLACGPRKARAIHDLFYGSVTRKFPASILQTHDDVTVVVDEAAAAELARAGFVDRRRADFTIYHEHTLPRGKRIAVISPHPDDSAISAGGIMSLLAPHNEVTTLVMTSGHRATMRAKAKAQRVKARKAEARAEAEALCVGCRFLDLSFYESKRIGAADEAKVFKELKKLDPHIVLLTSPEDSHPTHSMSTQLVTRAVKRLVEKRGSTVELWHYESPWWLFRPGDFNAFVPLPPKAVRKKLAAIRKHKSQVKRTPYDKVAESIALMRGITVPEQAMGGFGSLLPKHETHAEVFSVVSVAPERELIESLSGVRGTYGSELTEDVAERYAFAYGEWLREKLRAAPKVVIGRDTRPSGESLMQAMIRGLERAHCHVYRVGVGTTPLIQFEVRNHASHGGIIVTASHNEPDWNGFKFLWRDGGVLSPDQMEELIGRFHKMADSEWQARLTHYIKYVDDTLGKDTIKRIRKAGLKVVVDPNGGATIVLIKRLFEFFNVETVELNMDPGVFRHRVEPTRDALEYMGPIIREEGADLGVAWDCDGDRVEVLLSDGRHLSGHHVLALLVDEVLSGPVGKRSVVVSNATSNLVAEIAEGHGAKVYETDTGEPNVVRKMYQVGAPVGGEGACGGGIVPPSRCRDGVLTLFKILGLMVKRGRPLKEIVSAYPEYHTLMKNIRVAKKELHGLMRRIREHYEGHEIDVFEGRAGALKVRLAEGEFVLFRASKTERDVLRIITDARTAERAQQIMDEAMNLIV